MIKPVTIPVVDEDALMTYGRRGLASALSIEEQQEHHSSSCTHFQFAGYAEVFGRTPHLKRAVICKCGKLYSWIHVMICLWNINIG